MEFSLFSLTVGAFGLVCYIASASYALSIHKDEMILRMKCISCR